MSCNSSLIVSLASRCSVGCATITRLVPRVTTPDRNTPSPRRVRIHFHVLFKGLLEYQEHFEQDWTFFFCFCCRQNRRLQRCRRGERHGQTAQSSLKRSRARIFAARAVCSRSTGGSADFTFHYLMAARFDSLLPVSVKAELNVNQGPGREEHECKQIEPRAAQVGGTLSTERKGSKGRSRRCRVSPARRRRAPRAARSAATSNIHGNGLTIYHSSSQIVPSLFKVSNLSLRLDRLPCPSFFFFLFLSFLAAACFSNNAISVE